MREESLTVDVDKLREYMKNELYGAFFGGGYGGALINAMDFESLTDEGLVQMAVKAGIDLRKFSI